MSPQETLEVAEFHGDGISSELSEAVHRVAEALPIQVNFHPVDLSIERRRTDAEGWLLLDDLEEGSRDVTAYHPAFGWVDFDPTNDCVPGEDHVTLAHGRDYGDVSPVAGVVVGAGRQVLTVGVDVVAAPD